MNDRPLADASVPAPPRLHWALVLLFGLLTLGLFMLVWLFIQSNWIKKINPASQTTAQLVIYVVLMLLSEALSANRGLYVTLTLASYVVFYIALYSMRRSMLDHYNRVEPMGLILSPALVFLFSLFYLQHHMTRIARWKSGDTLRPQLP